MQETDAILCMPTLAVSPIVFSGIYSLKSMDRIAAVPGKALQ